MIRSRSLVVLASLVFAVAACGDDGSDGAERVADEPGPIPDACSVLAEDEIADLLGPGAEATATDGTAIDELDFRECLWETPDRALLGIAVVESSDRYDQAVALTEEGSLVDPEVVTDLGDGAVVAAGVSLEESGATGGRTVKVLDGDQTWSIALKLPGETPTDDLVELARTVLDRT